MTNVFSRMEILIGQTTTVDLETLGLLSAIFVAAAIIGLAFVSKYFIGLPDRVTKTEERHIALESRMTTMAQEHKELAGKFDSAMRQMYQETEKTNSALTAQNNILRDIRTAIKEQRQ